MSREGRSDCCMSIHHSITSRELPIVDSGPTNVGTGHMWKIIVFHAPTSILRTCARYVRRVMFEFPRESTASTKANILKHRLAQLYDYSTHRGTALVVNTTRRDPNQHYLCTASSVCMGFFVSSRTLQFYHRASRPRCKLASHGIIRMTPAGMFRYLTGALNTSRGIPRTRKTDVLCRQHRHVTGAQRGPRSLLPHFTCRRSFQPESQSTVTFSHSSHFDALPPHPYHKEPTETNK